MTPSEGENRVEVADSSMLEEEIKLTAQGLSTLEQLAEDEEIARLSLQSPWRMKPLLATYMDTPDGALLKHRMGFRFRQNQGTGRWDVCLKEEGFMRDGHCIRREWEQEINTPPTTLAALPPGAMRDELLTLAQGEMPLVRLVETDFMRRVRIVHLEQGSRVELVLDQGEIRAGGRSLPLFEVEIERKSGPSEPMLQFAHGLRHRYGLTPSKLSKFALGLTLLNLV